MLLYFSIIIIYHNYELLIIIYLDHNHNYNHHTQNRHLPLNFLTPLNFPLEALEFNQFFLLLFFLFQM